VRVLHVIAGAEFGGAETIAQDVITALAEAGIEQRAVARPYPIVRRHLAAAGVPLLPMAFSWRDRLGGGGFIRRQAREFGADIVQTWMSRAASFVPRDMPCPVAGWFGGYYDLKYYRHVDCFIGLTRDIVGYLRKGGVPEERAFLVHVFGTLADEPAADRAALATPADAPLVLVMARMHEKKGIDTVLRALAQCPGVYLWLAGEGPERGKYQALCRELGLDERVRFLGWRTDRAALYRAADIFVLPSRYEPFGAVIAEAWSQRRPLVATRAAGAAAYVTDEVDGLLCPIDDPAALARAIARLVDDGALRATLAEHGWRTYRRLFSKEAVVASWLDAFARMQRLGKRAPAQR
jgi:glycosyltransferase involved in cell wall biosynthesis